MNRWKVIVFVVLCMNAVVGLPLMARHIESSAPYLSGDTFRAFCDFHYDEVTTSFEPELVQPGDCIFVKTDMVKDFFAKKHPSIQHPYIIISHNSDDPAPGPGAAFLDDPKIVAWFAQNVEMKHPKLHPIPIGLANRMWSHGNSTLLAQKRLQAQGGQIMRPCLLYMNFAIHTFPEERQKVYDLFHQKPYCRAVSNCSWEAYLDDVARVKFVLSPRGNGLDTHRTWEALYMGAFPIVKESAMDSALKGLPVIRVKSWNVVTEEFLEKKYEEFLAKNYSYDKLFSPYWEGLIRAYKQKAVLQAP